VTGRLAARACTSHALTSFPALCADDLTLQRLPADILELILTKTPSLARCAAATTCQPLYAASRAVAPAEVEVPARAHPHAALDSPSSAACWASFIGWALRNANSLRALQLHKVLGASADVDVLFEWLAQIVTLCPGLSLRGACSINLHIRGKGQWGSPLSTAAPLPAPHPSPSPS